MFCPYCGYEVSDEFRFCPKCGKSMPCAKPTPPKNDDANGGTKKPRGRYSRIGGDHCGGWNKTQCPSQELARQKVKWWKRFEIPEGMSAKKCAVRFLIGLVVCYVGWLMMSASTGYDAVQMRDSEYVSLYGQNGPTLLQWFVCLIGTAVNVCGIAYAYHAWSRLLDHVKYRPGLPSWAAKVVAVVVCAVAFALFSYILAVIKHPTHGERIMSVWDYLVIAAVCKAIWRFFVGEKEQKPKTEADVERDRRANRNLLIRLTVYVGLGILAAVYICMPLGGIRTSSDSITNNSEVGQGHKECASIVIKEPNTGRIKVSGFKPNKVRVAKDGIVDEVKTTGPDEKKKRISVEALTDPRNQKAISEAIAKAQREAREKYDALPEDEKKRVDAERERRFRESADKLNRMLVISRVKSIRDAAANQVISDREAKDKIKAFLETQEGWSSKDFEKGWAGAKTAAQTMYVLGIYDIENMSLDAIVDMVSK